MPVDAAAVLGSSPHTRGARDRVFLRRLGERIIPAYAGSTARPSTSSAAFADHPRIRGEHDVSHITPLALDGSSPHTRGAPLICITDDPDVGIIPAYAGSTTSTASTPPWRRDHPRIRGEHSRRTDTCPYPTGSSPHTRGAHLRRISHFLDDRIIPAYAGSTPHCSTATGTSGDHPRIRGEHASNFTAPRGGMGSSPHTRGARLRGARRHQKCRIIPAYAGSTP